MLQLKLKKTQMIELNLKYLNLKEKYDHLSQHKNLSIQPEFGDISAISAYDENKSITRERRSEELNAIKERLAKFTLNNKMNKNEKDVILP